MTHDPIAKLCKLRAMICCAPADLVENGIRKEAQRMFTELENELATPPPAAGIELAVAELQAVKKHVRSYRVVGGEESSNTLAGIGGMGSHVLLFANERIAALRAEQPTPAEPAVQPVDEAEQELREIERAAGLSSDHKQALAEAVPPIPLDEAKVQETVDRAQETRHFAGALRESLSSLQFYINTMGNERAGEFDEATLDAMQEVQSALNLLARRELAREKQGGA